LRPKVLLITNIPTPYRIPLFNVLHEELTQRGIDFSVAFGALGYARRRWEINLEDCRFPSEVLPTAKFRFSDPEHSSFTYDGLARLLRKLKPDLVIANGFSIATTKLWLRSLIRGTPYLIWSGAISNQESRHWLRRLQRGLLVRRAAGFIAYGSCARDYLVELGAPKQRVEIGINTVDTSYYGAAEAKRTKNPEDAPKELIYVGHLTPGKRVDDILYIAKKLSAKRNDFIVRLVGSGHHEDALKTLTKELGLENTVRFEGFRQKPEVLGFLSTAYCFLFPSIYDIWGLVLVEAMAAGVPCVASIHAGGTCDLIQDGRNGFAVDFSDVDGVAGILDNLLDHPEHRRIMAGRAKAFVEQQVSLKKSAEGFVTAIERYLTAVANRSS
jgi:glycosyltransferase involved in cell wall biosynthesis